jgi:excisionase family DNA binding protein
MGDGGGTAAGAAQLGAGLAMGQQIAAALASQQATPVAAPPPLPTAAAAPALPELLSPADAAKALGVGEADVLAALTDGSLKGKKIGSAWRITRGALEEFLKS